MLRCLRSDPEKLNRQHDPDGWTYFNWNGDDTLNEAVTTASADYLQNSYLHTGQRRQHDGSDNTYEEIHDGEKLLAEMDESAGASRLYVNEGPSLGDALVMQCLTDAGTLHYPLFDALGSITGLTDEDGALSDSWYYDAFGRTLGRTGSTETPFQYIGAYGYYTTLFGLVNAWHRWYMPEIGKWLSRDPMGAFGQNPYTYVADLPTVWVDPAGLAPWRGAGAWFSDRWWDIKHIGAILKQVPQADIEVSESGYFNCYLKCMLPFSNTRYLSAGIDWLAPAPQDQLTRTTAARQIEKTTIGALRTLSKPVQWYYGYANWETRGGKPLWRGLAKRLALRREFLDLPGLQPTFEGLPRELATLQFRFEAIADIADFAGGVGWALTAVSSVNCMNKCYCHVEGVPGGQ